MKKISFILSLVALFFNTYSLANPFSTKVKPMVPQSQKASLKIKFKGFASIDNQHFGMVQIGKTDFEVVAGDVVEGIRFIKVSSSRLDYSINNQNQYILLDSD